MKTLPIAHTDLVVSRIALGCMQLGGSCDATEPTGVERSRAARLVATAVEQGINLFDHADIYACGKSETVFGEVLQQMPGLRQRIVPVVGTTRVERLLACCQADDITLNREQWYGLYNAARAVPLP